MNFIVWSTKLLFFAFLYSAFLIILEVYYSRSIELVQSQYVVFPSRFKPNGNDDFVEIWLENWRSDFYRFSLCPFWSPRIEFVKISRYTFNYSKFWKIFEKMVKEVHLFPNFLNKKIVLLGPPVIININDLKYILCYIIYVNYRHN